MVDGRWSMVDGRWSMVDGRWSMVDGRWSMVDGRWSSVHVVWVFGQTFIHVEPAGYALLPSTIDHRLDL